MDRELLDLYSDFLLSGTGERTATKLSAALGGFISHDKVTRFLSTEDYDSKTLWREVKPYVRKIEQPKGGSLIFDDTIEAKPHTDENKFEYVMADTWFSSSETMEFIHKRGKKFIFPVKSNRLVALTRHAKKFVCVNDMELEPNVAKVVYLKGLDLPVALTKKVFTNKDGSSGILYLVCNDTTLDGGQIYAIYKKRWKVEEYHKSLKSNLGLEASPTKVQRTQSNHVFGAIYAYFKLEMLSVKQGMNHFALKSKLLVSATRAAFDLLQNIKIA